MGTRADAFHRIDVLFHATVADGTTPAILQALMLRYISGAMRVLCITKERLETSGDDNAFVQIVEWVGDATYGPETEQEDGSVVRTATLPIRVRRTESRA